MNRLGIVLVPFMGVLLIGAASQAESPRTLLGSRISVFHDEKPPNQVITRDLPDEVVKRYQDMMQALFRRWLQDGVKFNFPTIRAGDDFLAPQAIIYGDEQYVLVNSNRLRNETSIGSLPELLLFGHELGHLYCGHKARDQKPNRAAELEADKFAGAALRALREDKQAEYAQAYQELTPERIGSAAHSLYYGTDAGVAQLGLQVRLNAIADGYENGSPCVERAAARLAK